MARVNEIKNKLTCPWLPSTTRYVVNPWDWFVDDGLTTWPSEEIKKNIEYIYLLNNLLVVIGFGTSGAKNDGMKINMYVYM